jgi:Polysaccharide pyruvyl transferase
MNILVAASRQWTPEHEWIFLGIRHLMEESFSRRLNWTLYDKNPDLRELKGNRLHRLNLKSNSFHHHTLLPFSAAVIAGTSEWNGAEMELFYGSLSKIEIPLFALGLEKPAGNRKLNTTQLSCLNRKNNLITVSHEDSRRWLSEFGLSSTLIPCPSLFASTEDPTSEDVETSGGHVGIVLHDSQRPDSAISEELVRRLCQTITQLSKKYTVDVICPTVADFMRFSTMFPENVRYSYEARDYLSLIAHCDVLVTTRTAFALAANSVLKPALLLSDSKETTPPHFLPHVHRCALADLDDKIKSLLDQPEMRTTIHLWKDQLKTQWKLLLKQHESFAGITDSLAA